MAAWLVLDPSAARRPGLVATLTGLTETGLAACLPLGLGGRADYLAGAGYTLLIWAVGEGFGGPHTSGSTLLAWQVQLPGGLRIAECGLRPPGHTPLRRSARPMRRAAFHRVQVCARRLGQSRLAGRSGAFPSVATLVRYTGLSEWTVRTCLAGLQAEGIIAPCDTDIVAAGSVFYSRGQSGLLSALSACSMQLKAIL